MGEAGARRSIWLWRIGSVAAVLWMMAAAYLLVMTTLLIAIFSSGWPEGPDGSFDIDGVMGPGWGVAEWLWASAGIAGLIMAGIVAPILFLRRALRRSVLSTDGQR